MTQWYICGYQTEIFSCKTKQTNILQQLVN